MLTDFSQQNLCPWGLDHNYGMSIHLLKGSHSCSVSNPGGHSQFLLRLSPVCAGEKPLGAHGWEGELSPLGVLNDYSGVPTALAFWNLCIILFLHTLLSSSSLGLLF